MTDHARGAVLESIRRDADVLKIGTDDIDLVWQMGLVAFRICRQRGADFPYDIEAIEAEPVEDAERPAASGVSERGLVYDGRQKYAVERRPDGQVSCTVWPIGCAPLDLDPRLDLLVGPEMSVTPGNEFDFGVSNHKSTFLAFGILASALGVDVVKGSRSHIRFRDQILVRIPAWLLSWSIAGYQIEDWWWADRHQSLGIISGLGPCDPVAGAIPRADRRSR